MQETPNRLIHIGKPIEFDDEQLEEQLKALNQISGMELEKEAVLNAVGQIVPTYHPQGIEKQGEGNGT